MKRFRRSIDVPAPTITGQARCWWVHPNQVYRPGLPTGDAGGEG